MTPLLLAAFAAVLGGAAPPAAAPSGAATVPAAQSAIAAKAADKQDAVVCKTKNMSGTRVKVRKICGKSREWSRASDAARGAADEVRDAARGGCNGSAGCNP